MSVCVRGILEKWRDGHKGVRREKDVTIRDQSRWGGWGGKREAAELEPAAEPGIKAVVYIINNEWTSN